MGQVINKFRSIISGILRRLWFLFSIQSTPDVYLDWSTRDPLSFLENLQDNPDRKSVFYRVQQGFFEEKFSSILEVGFGGAGQYTRMRDFFKKNSISYTGLEYTTHFVEATKERFKEANWVQGDICNMQFLDDSFDWVFTCHVLEHLNGYEEVKRAISELCRVARKVVIIMWFRWPTLIAETKGKFGDDGFFYYKYSATDIWKAVSLTDFEVRQISWVGSCIWELQRKK